MRLEVGIKSKRKQGVGLKQAIGMVFETEATILRSFTAKVGANMPVAKITSDSVRSISTAAAQ